MKNNPLQEQYNFSADKPDYTADAVSALYHARSFYAAAVRRGTMSGDTIGDTTENKMIRDKEDSLTYDISRTDDVVRLFEKASKLLHGTISGGVSNLMILRLLTLLLLSGKSSKSPARPELYGHHLRNRRNQNAGN